MKHLFVAAIAISTLYACNSTDKTAIAKPDVLAVNIDSTVKPGDDFFDYANGGWIKKNPIPGEQSSWGIGNLVMEENLKRLREISEKAAASKGAAGSNDQKIGDFWTMAMDSAKIEADGLKPIQPLLDKVNAITDIKSLISTISDLKKFGSSTLFGEGVSQDAKKSDVIAFTLWQGGISLGEREYYFKMDSATINIRNEYVKHIAKILTMSGEDASLAATAAKNILALETKLAMVSRKLEDLRDPYKNYNKMAIADLGKISGDIEWPAYLTAMGVKSIDSVIVGQPEFFTGMNKVLTSTPISDLKDYVKFNLLSDLSGILPDAYGIENFNFSKLFSGAKERRPRWKRAIAMEEDAMGEMLGQLYVK
ncbi:MAG: M13 family metallopeptidase N-terminal domain-containing protein, partial [Ferruginibacter sp.]